MLTINRSALKTVVCGVDWGFTNPGVLQTWAIDGDGRLILVHEIYQTGQLLEWWVERGKAVKEHFKPECFVCDPSQPASIEQFRRAGLNAVPADNDIRAGILAVQARLKVQPDGLPRLLIYDGSLEDRDETLAAAHKPVCLEQELDAYLWPKASDGRPVKEVPVDLNNHSADAMRYVVMWADARQRVSGCRVSSGGGGRVRPPGERPFGDVRHPPRGL